MKQDIHPEYREVVFVDTSSGDKFVTRSTISTEETVEFEGETYPMAKVEISSASHPFFTGQMKIVDTAGRVERFERRYGRRRGASVAEGEATDETQLAGDAAAGDAASDVADAAGSDEAPEAAVAEAAAPVADDVGATAGEDAADTDTSADDAAEGEAS